MSEGRSVDDSGRPGLARLRSRLSALALIGAPLCALVVYCLLPDHYLSPDGPVALTHAAKATAAIAVWMAIWWMTEALPIPATALLPVALFPLAKVTDIGTAAASYGHYLVFLFMGGFILSLAMERWALHKRIALRTVRLVGTRPANIVGGFMLATAGLSMWVSNTATAVMMLPIAVSVIDLMDRDAGEAQTPFAPCLLLGVAYSASIGGLGTLIGTPPNVFLASYIKDSFGREVSFAAWLGVGLPITVVLLPMTWLLLTKFSFRLRSTALPGAEQVMADAYRALGPVTKAEKLTLAVFACAVVAWICLPLLKGIEVAGLRPAAGLSDSGIALIAALSLFVLPSGRADGARLMDWQHAQRLPWGILILFGGGLSLAAAIDDSGVGAFIGASVGTLHGLPAMAVVLAVTALVIFLTELTSNLATTATFIPILAAVAPALDINPYLLIVTATIAASCAFMLPVATPPNAIVFGSGRISIQQMSRVGFQLNLIAVCVVTVLGYAVAARVLESWTP